MDSLNSLNKSLPRSFPRRQINADLHQAFKAAALSVAQLYKIAAADEDSARATGYQDAVEELLSFLDSENLGLGDGEGWRVRQWATERLSQNRYGSEDAEESNVNGDDRIHLRVKAPVERANKYADDISPRTIPIPQSQPSASRSTSTANAQILETKPVSTPRQDVYQFRAAQDDMDLEHSSPAHMITPKPVHRRVQRDRNSVIALGNLGSGAGQKRKSAFPDLLDFTDMDEDGAGGGGPKRGKLS